MDLAGEGPVVRIFGMGRSNSCHFCKNPPLWFKHKFTSVELFSNIEFNIKTI